MSEETYVKLECTNCHHIGYFVHKNKKKLTKVRLELSKYCKWCKTHQVHKETK